MISYETFKSEQNPDITLSTLLSGTLLHSWSPGFQHQLQARVQQEDRQTLVAARAFSRCSLNLR